MRVKTDQKKNHFVKYYAGKRCGKWDEKKVKKGRKGVYKEG